MSNDIRQYWIKDSMEDTFHFTEEELHVLSSEEKLALKERIQHAIDAQKKEGASFDTPSF